jgi:hypothetical protein
MRREDLQTVDRDLRRVDAAILAFWHVFGRSLCFVIPEGVAARACTPQLPVDPIPLEWVRIFQRCQIRDDETE